MFKLIKKKLKKILFPEHNSSLFFSQGGEDAILYGIFNKKIGIGEPGFYVDVGAYHPTIHSNTYLFYQKGWNGINLDACPGSMLKFEKLRQRDINLEIGVGNFNGESSFFVLDEKSTMNSFSKENLEHHGMLTGVTKEVNVEVSTLETILDSYSDIFEEIDFLSIDVEGMELTVLESNNWQKYKPKVIVLEMICTNIKDVAEHEITRYLAALGYQVVAKNLIMRGLASVFYVHIDYDY